MAIAAYLSALRRSLTGNVGSRAALEMLYLTARFHIRGRRRDWNIFTHLTPRERLLLFHLACQQRPGSTFVEIGSYLGASACFLAAAATSLGAGAHVHCVDTWKNDSMSEGPRDTWEIFRENTAGYGPVIVPHRGRSVDVARSFLGPVDLLFLDGDHSYEGCRADVLAWLPRLSRRGVVVFHDYGWAEGVRRVVDELIRPLQHDSGHVFENTYWTRVCQ